MPMIESFNLGEMDWVVLILPQTPTTLTRHFPQRQIQEQPNRPEHESQQQTRH